MAEHGDNRASGQLDRAPSTADVVLSKAYEILTFKDLSFDQYRILLFIAFLVNLLFFTLQVGRFFYLLVRSELGNDDALTLVILAFLLTTINMIQLVKLMWSPTPRVAVSCMGLIIVQEGVFIGETAAYYNDIVNGQSWLLALSIIFLFLQLISVLVVYRYWEFLLFNFDAEQWSRGGGENGAGNLSMDATFVDRLSTGGIHPSKAVKNPVHPPPPPPPEHDV